MRSDSEKQLEKVTSMLEKQRREALLLAFRAEEARQLLLNGTFSPDKLINELIGDLNHFGTVEHRGHAVVDFKEIARRLEGSSVINTEIPEDRIVSAGPYSLNATTRLLTISGPYKAINLGSNQEIVKKLDNIPTRLLEILMVNAGRIVPYISMEDWGWQDDGFDHRLHISPYMSHIRNAVLDSKNPKNPTRFRLINNHIQAGYSFDFDNTLRR